MRVRIHRGSHEIGGNCIELEAEGARIVLDLGRPLWAAPGVEVPLPETEGKREILKIHMAKAEAIAGRRLFAELDVDAVLARTVKLNSADLAELVRRSLEEKVQQEGAGEEPAPVTTTDMQRAIENYRKTKEIIEKIRYGQYL